MQFFLIAFFSVFFISSVSASMEYETLVSHDVSWSLLGIPFGVGMLLGIVAHMIWIHFRYKKIEASEVMGQEVSSVILTAESSKIIPPIPMVGSALSNNTSEVLVGQANISENSTELKHIKNDLSDVLVSENITGDSVIFSDMESHASFDMSNDIEENGAHIGSPVSMIDLPRPHVQPLLEKQETIPALASSGHSLLASSEPLLELDTPAETALLSIGVSPVLLDEGK